MRYDMDRVIIERPRYHQFIRYHHVRSRGPVEKWEDLPNKEGMRRPFLGLGLGEKEFSDLVRPLYGFLSSRVGQKWDKVYSEIRAHVNPNSTTQIHLVQHVFQFVERYVDLDEAGQPHRRARGRYDRSGLSAGELYVHPESGLLCRVPEVAWPSPRPVEKYVIALEDGRELRRIGGIWYWMAFADVTPPATRIVWGDGAFHERRIGGAAIDAITGEKIVYPGRYRTGKRQANRKDLQRHGVKNEQPA